MRGGKNYSPNHSISSFTDIRQVRVAGADVKNLAPHRLRAGLGASGFILRNSANRPGSSSAVGALGPNRCSAARIRHSSSPIRSCFVRLVLQQIIAAPGIFY